MRAEIWAEPAWKLHSSSQPGFVGIAGFLQWSALGQDSGTGTAQTSLSQSFFISVVLYLLLQAVL